MTESKYNCLNCGEPIEFDDDSNFITTCENCNWRNELNDSSAIDPIILKKKKDQICYPMIEEKDLKYLPESLKKAVLSYFKEEDFSKKEYQNIYHNLFSKNARKFKELGMKYMQKAKLAEFFQSTNFTNLPWSKKLMITMERPMGIWRQRIHDRFAVEIFEIEDLLKHEDPEALENYFIENKIEVMDYWDFIDSPQMEEWKQDYLWNSEKYHNVVKKEASEWIKKHWKDLERDDIETFFDMIKKNDDVWIETCYSKDYVVDECYDWSVVVDGLLDSLDSKIHIDQISDELEEQARNEEEYEELS